MSIIRPFHDHVNAYDGIPRPSGMGYDSYPRNRYKPVLPGGVAGRTLTAYLIDEENPTTERVLEKLEPDGVQFGFFNGVSKVIAFVPNQVEGGIYPGNYELDVDITWTFDHEISIESNHYVFVGLIPKSAQWDYDLPITWENMPWSTTSGMSDNYIVRERDEFAHNPAHTIEYSMQFAQDVVATARDPWNGMLIGPVMPTGGMLMSASNSYRQLFIGPGEYEYDDQVTMDCTFWGYQFLSET